jgi:hypothetical protein
VLGELRRRGHRVEVAEEWTVGRLTAASAMPTAPARRGDAAPDAGLRGRPLSEEEG